MLGIILLSVNLFDTHKNLWDIFCHDPQLTHIETETESMIYLILFFQEVLELEYERKQSPTPKSVLFDTWVSHNIIKDF